ncbi:hypothetical protein CFBP4996_28885 (plasmid) [Agrobacterium leguminum]|uniref:hypothetical protein n=1 Tax=Agrobacterium leguminum TaxID=2792015 RepID=UPI000EB21927|nr:hypothetical protein [Agrobacterium leguminum]WFS70140.1 hypothetical protein CFBP4996_28885 [Agrobacterium leguminum]
MPSVAGQIGNALTPAVAQAGGLAMFSLLRRREFDRKAMLFGVCDSAAVTPPRWIQRI